MTAPERLAQMMPTVREIEASLVANGYVKDSPEWEQMFRHQWAFYLKFVGVPK